MLAAIGAFRKEGVGGLGLGFGVLGVGVGFTGVGLNILFAIFSLDILPMQAKPSLQGKQTYPTSGLILDRKA